MNENSQDICGADNVQKRRCPVTDPSYSACISCPYINSFNVNLGEPGKRGGTEDLTDLLGWRRKKRELGIAHGDAE